jgi:hypothetical protein
MNWPRRAPVIWVSLFFRWYDLWIGVYIDRPNQTIYICPLPTLGIKIRWHMEEV